MKRWLPVLAVLGLLVLAGCAAGPESDWSGPDADPAGFWAGLWHGILLVVALVVSFFTNDVRIYELHNTGLGYDIGFVLGVLAVYGSGTHVSIGRKCRRGGKEKDDIGKKVEAEVKRRVHVMLEDDADWKELGEKIEKKVKDRLRRWLAEEDGKPEGS